MSREGTRWLLPCASTYSKRLPYDSRCGGTWQVLIELDVRHSSCKWRDSTRAQPARVRWQREADGSWQRTCSHSCRRMALRHVALERPKAATSLSSSRLSRLRWLIL